LFYSNEQTCKEPHNATMNTLIEKCPFNVLTDDTLDDSALV